MKYACIFFFILIAPGSFSQEKDPFKNSRKEPEPKSMGTQGKTEEVDAPDGTYKKVENGTVTRGHHINNQFHGEFIEKGHLYTISKTYDHGNLIGYETGKLTYDNNPADKQEHWKKGPYFAGKRPSGFFTISHYGWNSFLNEGYFLHREDTVFFSPNKDIEIRRHVSIEGESDVNLEPATLIFRIYGTKKTSYSTDDLELALKTKTYQYKHFLSNEFNPDGEVIQYNSKGIRVAASYPEYRLTFHPNGAVHDSICKAGTPYQHYRFDANKKEIFRTQAEFFPEIKKQGKTVTYSRNNQPFYTISFVETRLDKNKPVQISSSNDSIKHLIKSGLFCDYYGTTYLTQADGRIDTSFSKEVYPYRYQTKLKNGNYYFLSSSLTVVVYVLTVTDEKMEIYTFNTQDLKGKTWNHYFVKRVMQKGNYYLLSEPFTNKSVRICVNNGNTYCSDWIDEKPKGRYEKLNKNTTYSIDIVSDWELSPYDLNDVAADFTADTLFSFRSQLLTENEFEKALNGKHITKMSRSEFDGIVQTMKKVRKQEEEALSKLRASGLNEIFIDSKQFCQLVYRLGYNPYFSEDDVVQLMTDLKFTHEEQEPLKELLFVRSWHR